ncbi:Thiol-disulfide oxidoreductase C [Streptococcus pneumoniae]|nr:Thiol-disulfide oxidoreductase C [Streptococcus pneumoniae]CKG16282.1 Thiol-disulfide oxidoreductase C [Streptococcus pneumoniae]
MLVSKDGHVAISINIRYRYVVSTYAFPLACIGLLIAVYQITIQAFPTSELKMCSVGVSCTGDYLNLFGSISIPMLSFVGFLGIIILLYIKLDRETKDRATKWL